MNTAACALTPSITIWITGESQILFTPPSMVVKVTNLSSMKLKLWQRFLSYRRNIADEELGPIRAAQAICKRLRRRDIYAYVDEITIPPHLVDDDLGNVPSGAAAGTNALWNNVNWCPKHRAVIALAARFVTIVSTHAAIVLHIFHCPQADCAI